VLHICNPRTQEAGARVSQILGQPGIYSKILSQKKKIIRKYSKISLGGQEVFIIKAQKAKAKKEKRDRLIRM
jgi:hypothetical protein